MAAHGRPGTMRCRQATAAALVCVGRLFVNRPNEPTASDSMFVVTIHGDIVRSFVRVPLCVGHLVCETNALQIQDKGMCCVLCRQTDRQTDRALLKHSLK